MAIIEGTHKLGTGLYTGRAKPAVARYDFAVDGGATGAVTLRGDTIPSGAIIVDALLDIETACASATGTMAIGTEGAADILSATGQAGLTAGAKRATLTATSTPVKTTARRNITLTIATAAFTAGKFTAVVWFVEIA